MTNEPTHEEISEDDDQPATKRDIRIAQDELAQATANSFTALDKRFDKIEATMPTKVNLEQFATKDDLANLENRMVNNFATKDQVTTILNVVQSIDQRLKDWQDIPERVANLEDQVAELSLKQGAGR